MMVGICLAMNEPVQLENHLRGALMQGATAREVLEVILHSTAYVGMPTTIMQRRMLEKVLKEEGRSGELEGA
jgi:4-carboxymuconolactone decarboxylase